MVSAKDVFEYEIQSKAIYLIILALTIFVVIKLGVVRAQFTNVFSWFWVISFITGTIATLITFRKSVPTWVWKLLSVLGLLGFAAWLFRQPLMEWLQTIA
ncbi:MAG: hypothetical protein DRP42_03260 [Tenericutes bacterium]|nr:MAG: hypothetical protein DRP42_03260 [Mycoplasmatota bacterium]